MEIFNPIWKKSILMKKIRLRIDRTFLEQLPPFSHCVKSNTSNQLGRCVEFLGNEQETESV